MTALASGIELGTKIPSVLEEESTETGIVLVSREGRFRVDSRVLPFKAMVDNFATRGAVGDALTLLESSNGEVRKAMAYLERVLGRWHAFKDSRPGKPGLLETLNHRQHIADLQRDVEPAKNGLLLTIIKAKGWAEELRVKE